MQTDKTNIDKRTKGEWYLHEPTFYSNRRRVNIDKDAATILVIEDYTDNKEEAAANAEFIVTACNNYDALVEALRKSINNINQLCEMVNHFSNKLSLGNKVKNEDFTEVAKQLLNQLNESK